MFLPFPPVFGELGQTNSIQRRRRGQQPCGPPAGEIAMPDLRFLTKVPLCLLLAGAACSAPLAAATAATATTAVDASVVAAAVKQRLRAEREQELADLTVQVLGDGTVWLSGRTYTQA